MYFSAFPKTLYTFDGKTPLAVTNIFSRVKMRYEVIQNAFANYKYQLVDGDTPEIVSYKEYGSADYYWIVCLANNLVDPQFEFPLSDISLNDYIIKKYNYASINESFSNIHHYELVKQNELVEKYGPTTRWTEKYTVSLQDFLYSSDTLVTRAINSPTTTSAVFRSNNANANTEITSTLSTTTTVTPVYVYDYEVSVNESKREIKMLKSEYLQTIVSELGSVING